MSTDDQTLYDHRSGSGANAPKGHERKEQDPSWQRRQGGDQSRGDADRSDPTGDKVRGKETLGAGATASRLHLEGSEQGPS
jgi:hypothetical protein